MSLLKKLDCSLDTLVCALDAYLFQNYVSFDDLEYSIHDDGNPEKSAMKSEAWGQLTEDAQVLFQLVLNPPSHLATQFTSTRGHDEISRSRVYEYMRTLGWSLTRIDKAFYNFKSVLTEVASI